MDLRFLDPDGQPTREAFNERFEFLNAITPRLGNISNEYVWEKIENQYSWTEEVTNAGAITSYNSGTKLYLGDSFHVENGLFVLDNPVLVTLSTSVNPQTVLVGKYACVGWGTQDSIVYYYKNTGTYKWSGTVLSIPAKGRIQYIDIVTTKVLAGYVNSPDPNAYPPAVSDGFTYNLLGQLANLGAKVETGSYVGTGKHGASNPNSLTFSFKPKFLVVTTFNGGGLDRGDSFMWLDGVASKIGDAHLGSFRFSVNGNTVSWYLTYNDPGVQCNASGTVYYYIAIG